MVVFCFLSPSFLRRFWGVFIFSPQGRPRRFRSKAASGRPVGLSTGLAFLSTTISTATTVGIQLVTNISNSFSTTIISVIKGLLPQQHSGWVGRFLYTVLAATPFHCPSFFVFCCFSRLSWWRYPKVPPLVVVRYGALYRGVLYLTSRRSSWCSVPWLPALSFCGTGWRFYCNHHRFTPLPFVSPNNWHYWPPLETFHSNLLPVPMLAITLYRHASGPVISHARSRRCHH